MCCGEDQAGEVQVLSSASDVTPSSAVASTAAERHADDYFDRVNEAFTDSYTGYSSTNDVTGTETTTTTTSNESRVKNEETTNGLLI